MLVFGLEKVPSERRIRGGLIAVRSMWSNFASNDPRSEASLPGSLIVAWAGVPVLRNVSFGARIPKYALYDIGTRMSRMTHCPSTNRVTSYAYK